MWTNILGGIARALVPAVIAYTVGKGWLSQTAWDEIGAIVVAVASATWSVQTNSGGKNA